MFEARHVKILAPAGLVLACVAGCGNASSPLDPEVGELGSALPVSQGTVTAGMYHACILADKHVKCWGYNVNGQLGLGNLASRGDTPGEMGDNLPWVDLGQW